MRGARPAGGPRPRSRANKAGGHGACYLQQEAHVDRGEGCGLCGREASGLAAVRDAESREKDPATRRTRRSNGASATTWALLVPMAGRGGGSGKRTARVTQLGGEGQGGGKKPADSSEDPPPRRCPGSLSPAARRPFPPRELSRDWRRPPPVPDCRAGWLTVGSPQQPRALGRQGGGVRRREGSWPSDPEAAGPTPAWLGPAVRDEISSKSCAQSECPAKDGGRVWNRFLGSSLKTGGSFIRWEWFGCGWARRDQG